jgi:NAD-dependent DNA ligase
VSAEQADAGPPGDQAGAKGELVMAFTVERTVISGKTVVVTGMFQNHSRCDLAACIEKNGGKLDRRVSKQTDFVVAGEFAGSSVPRARQLGIPILTDQEFESSLAALERAN